MAFDDQNRKSWRDQSVIGKLIDCMINGDDRWIRDRHVIDHVVFNVLIIEYLVFIQLYYCADVSHSVLYVKYTEVWTKKPNF